MARRNSKGLELTWDASRKRWKKVIDGETHYFGKGRCKTDRESYAAALERYRVFMGERAESEKHQRLLSDDDAIPYRRAAHKKRAKRVSNLMASIDKKMKAGEYARTDDGNYVIPHNEFVQFMEAKKELELFRHNEAYQYKAVLATIQESVADLKARFDRIGLDNPEVGTISITKQQATSDKAIAIVSDIIDDFLSRQGERGTWRKYFEDRQENGEDVAEAKGQGISTSRLRALQNYAGKIKAVFGDRPWAGTEQDATVLASDIRKHAESLLLAGEIKPNTFNEWVKTVSQVIRYAHETHRLDNLPRNLTKLCSKLSYEATAKAIPVETIHQLWAVATDTEKAYVSLGLMGYYAKDVSDLLHENIVDGRIVRDRKKTGVESCHRMFNVTAALIAKTSNGERRLYVDENGRPLVDDNRGTRDLIGRAWEKLCKRAGVTGYSFSNLRDTSSTIVKAKFPQFHSMFLSHSDNGVATKYVDFSETRDTLDGVMVYLDGIYGLK